MSRYDLLPPNATQLERDLSRASSFLERIGRPVPTIRTAKRINIPDGVVPWLVYEYGLGELLPYLSDQRRAIAEGVLWQRVRGTPAALKIGLSWIGLIAELEESEAGTLRWAEYQLGLEAAPNGLEQIGRLVGIARISQPIRSRLFRVYGGYDERRFLLDYHLLGEGLLCDHSGVYDLEPGWPQLSFGQRFGAWVVAGVSVSNARARSHGARVEYPDRWLLDRDLLDDGWHVLNHPVVHNSSSEGARRWGSSASTDQVSYWDQRTWAEAEVWTVPDSAQAGLRISRTVQWDGEEWWGPWVQGWWWEDRMYADWVGD